MPVARITLRGTGANRTIGLKPAPNKFGTATITITVSDGTLTTATSFVLTVDNVNDPPTITTVADQTIAQNTSTLPLVFKIADIDGLAGISVTAASSNTALVPDERVVLTGVGGTRTITVTPAADQTGETIITLTVSDGVASATSTFVVTVTGS